MNWFLRSTFRSVVVLLSLAAGVASGVLVVRYVVPAPQLFLNGGREGTPVQIVGFLSTFVIVTALTATLGLHFLELRLRRRDSDER